ncbi:hypothetical protein J4573_26855 [Actinomadura barringtoniae]|uniref:Secreted protein n=1 Tax=Actinomadura barringtoniae TaxID=1427535 RepID=A0A939PLH3_9ACTN|nr:hypothetical protein [Actinomadura barringtoniae]MBO2450751.1 hypothetical protein [Actinomadura barringtoniae]
MTYADQLPALVGVVIGAIGSYTVSSLTERSRWRRARAERWDQSKLQAYTRYANSLKAQFRIATRIAAARGLATAVEPMDPHEGLQQFAEAESRRTAEWESMLLLADVTTIAAARAWHEAVWGLRPYIRGLHDDPEDWRRALQRTSHARDGFYAAARNDLGIEGVPPHPSPWPGDTEDHDAPP